MPLRIAVVVGLTASCVSIATAEAQSVGPLKVGDAVEVTFGGNWQPGVVTAAEGLTYFVHWGPESDRGKFDRFNHLYQLRQPGSQQTLDQTYHEKTADPAGGPVAIGETVEYNAVTGWAPYRVARRVGEVYVLFPERERERNYGEKWATLAEMRPVGSTQMFAAAPPPKPPTPQKLEDVKVGDLIEVYKRGGYGWFTARVMSVQNGRYYVQAGADSAMVGWVTPVHMRGVGAKERFEPEKLEQFFGDWRLRGDAFFTTTKTVRHSDRIEKTMELNSGAGQDAGRVVIKADGTYVLQKTVVYADNKPGKWVRNPDQSEGGIVLQGGQSDGKDLLVTPYPGGGIYLQGALRGPGKVGTK